MKNHPQTPPKRPQPRTIALLFLAASLALTLGWWRPWRSASPAPSPTPARLVGAATATPAVTATPASIALPTVPAQRSTPPLTTAPATPMLATPATPAPGVAPQEGTLYFLGFVDGRAGVVASDASGAQQRLLVPGLYTSLAVSPDSERLAVVGPIPDGGVDHQLAIFTEDGRALARYPFGRGTNSPLSWSPSGRYLLGSVVLNVTPATSPVWEVRVFADEGYWRVSLPAIANTFTFGWSPDDRLTFISSDPSSQATSPTLWTTDASGGDRRRLYSGTFAPLAWNRDGSLFYALAPTISGNPNAALNQLIAIEYPYGFTRTIAQADALAAAELGVPNVANTYRFDLAQPSPDGTLFALGIARGAGLGTPIPRDESRTQAIIFMHVDSRVVGLAFLPPGDSRGPTSWSADSSHFALLVSDGTTGDGLILGFATAGRQTLALPVERAYVGLIPQLFWSPNGRRLAYTALGGLWLATGEGGDNTLIARGGTAPVWRPGR